MGKTSLSSSLMGISGNQLDHPSKNSSKVDSILTRIAAPIPTNSLVPNNSKTRPKSSKGQSSPRLPKREPSKQKASKSTNLQSSTTKHPSEKPSSASVDKQAKKHVEKKN